MLSLLTDVVRRTRQHHAIEHATIHMLSARFPHRRFSGYSDPIGFTILGDVDEAELRRAVGDALLRLQAGEAKLAIHPNCGTNLATTGVLATAAVLTASTVARRGMLERFVLGLVLVLPALVAAQPLGYHFQGYTTLADVSDRWVADIHPLSAGQGRLFRVRFD